MICDYQQYHLLLNSKTKKVRKMKQFMNPEIEVIKFSVEDVINESVVIPTLLGDCITAGGK